jgi:Rrf2 family iron-sulfur cluster assembly transcriptional regulator
MLSLSCKYALRAVVYIMSKGGQRLGIKEIAAAIEANEHTTAKILQVLAREGIIHSAKGPKGGFYLLPDATPLYLMQIVRVVDGEDFFYECGLGLKECSESKPCPIHHAYKALRAGLHEQFSTITVQQLSNDLALGKAFLKR